MAHHSSQGSYEFPRESTISPYEQFENTQQEEQIPNTNLESITTNTSQSRQPRSNVWNFFEKNIEEGKVRCKICSKMYSYKKGDGLGTLSRHVKK